MSNVNNNFSINLNKEIWEGWKVIDFIEEIKEEINIFISNNKKRNKIITKEDLKKFCTEHQPYYKKYIPEVVNYFANKYNII